MSGKAKCKILKEIRQRIADENDIPYVTRECTYQGDCAGTCPRCESELRYLEQELEKRSRLGKKVAVTALCAGMALSSAACAGPGDDLAGEAMPAPTEEALAGAAEPAPTEEAPEEVVLAGEVEEWDGGCSTLETPEDAFEGLETFESTVNTGAVYENARSCPLYTPDREVALKAVSTYHWNGGEGAAPGEIRIYDVTDGTNKLLGTWMATSRAGSGAESVYWDIFPDIVLQAGHTYHIIDSDAQSWSANEESGYIGFTELYTEEGAGEGLSGTIAPCSEREHSDV